MVAATAAGVFWSYRLAGSSFAPAPRAQSGGLVAIGVDDSTGQGSSSGAEPAVSVNLVFGGALPDRNAHMSVIVVPQGNTGESRPSATHLLVLLCGSLAQAPDFVNDAGRTVAWAPALDGRLAQFTAQLELGTKVCVYTRVPLSAAADGSPIHSLQGTVKSPVATVSGKRVLYALPPVIDAQGLTVGGRFLQRLPAGSKVRLDLAGAPPDFLPGLSSPALPDSGTLEWPVNFAGDSLPAFGYRVSGELADQDAHQQRDLFLAGVLAGVAGGGVLLFLEVIIKVLFGNDKKAHITPPASSGVLRQNNFPGTDRLKRVVTDAAARPRKGREGVLQGF